MFLDETIKAFASNGPWALAAAYLLRELMKRGEDDRKQISELLNGFRQALEKLTQAVEDLRDEMRSK